jgi:hypothetical protein
VVPGLFDSKASLRVVALGRSTGLLVPPPSCFTTFLNPRAGPQNVLFHRRSLGMSCSVHGVSGSASHVPLTWDQSWRLAS